MENSGARTALIAQFSNRTAQFCRLTSRNSQKLFLSVYSEDERQRLLKIWAPRCSFARIENCAGQNSSDYCWLAVVGELAVFQTRQSFVVFLGWVAP